MGRPRRDRVGEPRLPRLGHDGSARQPRPAVASGRPTSTRRPAGWCGSSGGTSPTSSRPTTTSAATATRTTSGPTTSRSGRSSGPATPAWYPEQLAPEHGGTGPSERGGLAPWAPSKLYEQAIPASVREAMAERLKELGPARASGSRPRTRRRSSIEEFEAYVGEDARARRADHDLDRHLRRRRSTRSGRRSSEHVTQISHESPFMLSAWTAGGSAGRRRRTSSRESRVDVGCPRRTCSPGSSERRRQRSLASTRAAGPSRRRRPGP